MLRNIIGPSIDSKKGKFLSSFFLQFFFEKSYFSCRKKMFEKQKWKKEENLDQVLTQKGYFGPSFDSYSIYIYIYIYSVELKIRPKFGGF